MVQTIVFVVYTLQYCTSLSYIPTLTFTLHPHPYVTVTNTKH